MQIQKSMLELGSSATILETVLGHPRYLARRPKLPYASRLNTSETTQSGNREISSRHVPIVSVTIETALYAIKIQTGNLVGNPARCSDVLELMSDIQVSYFRTGLVLPASCFCRRTCVRCPLESRFLFFSLLFLSIIFVTPF
jgi:hypothetical protein